MLAPAAYFRLTPATSVRNGSRMIPPPIPSRAPAIPAKIEKQKSSPKKAIGNSIQSGHVHSGDRPEDQGAPRQDEVGRPDDGQRPLVTRSRALPADFEQGTQGRGG